MAKIAFFCIPAHGHTNPTVAVVRNLTAQGHAVWYASFAPFRERLEQVGAQYFSCDFALPPLQSGDEKRVGRDFSALIGMATEVTLALESEVCAALRDFGPDCIVSDSLCIWGKLFARRLGIPYLCSTTTFAFNAHTAALMRGTLSETIHALRGRGRIAQCMERLRAHGYDVPDLLSLIANTNDTDTIVYTSREFQPMADTFSDRFVFVGPSLDPPVCSPVQRSRPQVYISLGTVNNRNDRFYRACFEALGDLDVDVVLSVGEQTDPASFENVPERFCIAQSVRQTTVLQQTDVFLTHCGMNSVSESLYFGVPMVLYPQQQEQRLVASRAEQIGAGIRIRQGTAPVLREAVLRVLNDPRYRLAAHRMGQTFRQAGGAARAAQTILRIATRHTSDA